MENGKFGKGNEMPESVKEAGIVATVFNGKLKEQPMISLLVSLTLSLTAVNEIFSYKILKKKGISLNYLRFAFCKDKTV